MKHYIKISLILLIGFITFSCDTNDELLTDNNQNAIENDIALVTSNGSGRANTRYSMLHFESMKSFHKTIDNLEQKAEQLDDAFLATFDARLTEDEFLQAEIDNGFNSYQAFNDFAAKYNFQNSLLKSYIKAEGNWLDNPELDFSNDPDIAFLDLEPEQMVVLNDDGAVQIGNDIYQIYNGGTLVFNNTSVDTFAGALDFSGLDFSGVDFGITWGGLGFDWDNIYGGTYDYTDVSDSSYLPTCFQSATDRDHWSTGSRRRLKGVVKAVNSGLWGKKIKSKSKYYKKTWGVWHTTRASSLKAALQGEIHDNSCTGPTVILDESTDFKYDTNKKSVKYKIGSTNVNFDEIFIPYNQLKGIHYKGGSNRHEHTLEL